MEHIAQQSGRRRNDTGTAMAAALTASNSDRGVLVFKDLPDDIDTQTQDWVAKGWLVGIDSIAGGLQHVVWARKPGDGEKAELRDRRR